MFFLTYGGCPLGYDEILDMDFESRQWYVQRLDKQLEFERQEAEKD